MNVAQVLWLGKGYIDLAPAKSKRVASPPKHLIDARSSGLVNIMIIK